MVNGAAPYLLAGRASCIRSAVDTVSGYKALHGRPDLGAGGGEVVPDGLSEFLQRRHDFPKVIGVHLAGEGDRGHQGVVVDHPTDHQPGRPARPADHLPTKLGPIDTLRCLVPMPVRSSTRRRRQSGDRGEMF